MAPAHGNLAGDENGLVASTTNMTRAASSLVPLLKHGPRFSPLMRFAWVKRAVDRFAELRFPGPDEAARRTRRNQIWCRVTDADGTRRQGFLETPEPYQFTLATALGAVERVLAGSVRPGAWTPSQAFGCDFVTELGGCAMELESRPHARTG